MHMGDMIIECYPVNEPAKDLEDFDRVGIGEFGTDKARDGPFGGRDTTKFFRAKFSLTE